MRIRHPPTHLLMGLWVVLLTLAFNVNVTARPLDSGREEILPSGPKVWWVERQGLPAVSARWVFHAGTRFEPDSLAGLAVLTASALLDGQEKSKEFIEAFEGRGAVLEARVDGDATVFSLECPAESADTLLQVLAEALRDPQFSPDALSSGFEEAHARSLRGAVDVLEAAESALMRALDQGLSYGRSKWGYPETWARISQGEVPAFHEAHFIWEDSHLIVIGPVDFDRLLGNLAGIPRSRRAAVGPPPRVEQRAAGKRRILLIDAPESEEAGIAVGVPAVSRGSPHALDLSLAEVFLGNGPLSRLSRLRHVDRLAYAPEGRVLFRDLGGALVLSLSAAAEVTGEAVARILDSLSGLVNGGVSAEEFEAARVFWNGRRQIELESPSRCAEDLVAAALAGLDLSDWTSLPDRVMELDWISWSGALRQSVDPTSATIVVAGPTERVIGLLEGLGEVEESGE